MEHCAAARGAIGLRDIAGVNGHSKLDEHLELGKTMMLENDILTSLTELSYRVKLETDYKPKLI